jgi:predicted DsbA family dithiol-disulfide isomerase
VHGSPVKQARLIERIFTAYFVEGEDIGHPSVLERLALECGLQAEGPGGHPGDGRGRGEGHRTSYPVGGVPCFVFDGSLMLSGAATPDALADVMFRALRA